MSAENEQSEGLASPEPSQRFHGAVPKLGAPFADFLYRNAFGRDVLHVTRYRRQPDPTAPSVDDGPITRYWTWSIGEGKWLMGKGSPRPAPLLNSDLLCSQPERPVYLFDNEESAQQFQSMLLENDIEAIATCWAGGATSALNIDLQLLRGHPVYLWPSNTSAAQAVMLGIAGRVFRLLEESGFETTFIRVPSDKPGGWNVSTAVVAGWSWGDLDTFIMMQGYQLSEAPQKLSPEPVQLQRLTTEQQTTVVHREPRTRPGKMIDAIDGSLSHRWREYSLAVAPNGLPHTNLFNVGKIIQFHKGAYCDVWLDEFHNKIMTQETATNKAREWSEADTLEFTRFIQDPSGVGLSKIGTGTVHDAVVLQASKNKRNEVREWLEQLRWDGVPRLHASFSKGWGTVDSPYYQAIGRCFIMGAAARILRPGCQVDTLPVFEGPEGIFKSSALMALAGDEWYDSPTYELGEFDFLQSMRGKWILELAEMANLSGKSGEKGRAIITRRNDTYRPSYGRVPVTFPRMCVFGATTNDDEWNTSQFGARRFWPVLCTHVDLGLIKEMREQWFAEAVHRVEANEKWYDIPLDDLKLEQAKRMPSDLWDQKVREFVEGRMEVTLGHIASGALNMDAAQQSPLVKQRITSIMKKLNWYASRANDGSRVWRPVPSAAQARQLPLDGPHHEF